MQTINIIEQIELTYGRIVVAEISPEAEHSKLLTEEDCEHLATLAAPARRAQWSTARVILRHLLGPEASIRYGATGAPILTRPIGEVAYVSISHSDERVAVMLCRNRCSVDVEQLGRNFSRVASRYISHEERSAFEQKVGGNFEAIMWSAEEALYKFGSNPGLDFIRDMVITGFDTEAQTISAELYGLATPKVSYRIMGDHVLCYVSDNK